MKTWLTTDTHFGHFKMVQYCGRPADFSERILVNLGNSVKPGDLLIHLGDFCIGDDGVWHGRYLEDFLPGVKHWLVRGNHDRNSNTWYLGHGWDMVCDSFTLEMFGKRILFPLTHLWATVAILYPVVADIYFISEIGNRGRNCDGLYFFHFLGLRWPACLIVLYSLPHASAISLPLSMARHFSTELYPASQPLSMRPKVRVYFVPLWRRWMGREWASWRAVMPQFTA